MRFISRFWDLSRFLDAIYELMRQDWNISMLVTGDGAPAMIKAMIQVVYYAGMSTSSRVGVD